MSALAYLFTREDLYHCKQELAALERALYSSPQQSQETLLATVVSKPTAVYLTTRLGSTQTTDALSTQLQTIQQELTHARIFSLTLAFSPSSSFLRHIGTSVKETFGEDTLIALTVDPHIVGGAVVSFNGQYKDYSVKKKLDSYFQHAQLTMTS